MTKSIILILMTLGFSLSFSHAQEKWIEKPGIPVERSEAVAFSIDNLIYVGTGRVGFLAENDFWRFDPGTDTWTEIDSMPTKGRRGAFSFVINNKAYVGGGVTTEYVDDFEFWEYDPSQSKWTRKSDIPAGLEFDSETLQGFSIDSKGYLVAPFSAPNFYMYDPESDSWSEKATYPGQLASRQISFSIGTKGYVGGGVGLRDYYVDFWEYNSVLDYWVRRADIPGDPRQLAVSFSIGDYGYVGLGRFHLEYLHDFWEYDSKTKSWAQIDSCHTYLEYALGVSTDTKGYIGTGFNIGSDSGWWEFNPSISFVDVIDRKYEITIYPNPAKGSLYIDNEEFYNLPYAIFSITGQLMKKGESLHGPIDINELPAGIYFIKINMTDRMESCKFIKE